MKKTLALILSAAVLLSFAACSKKDNEETIQETADYSETSTLAVYEEKITLPIEGTTSSFAANNDESTAAVSAESDNPEEWSTAKIIDVYKNAAAKTHPKVKSAHGIDLKSISVNNGQYEGLFEFITPIMSKLLANNSTEKDGITGGYKNLVEGDVASAKAYKSGNNIVVELVMKNQTSGPREDALSGSVGHAITAVGDIGVVVDEMKDLGLPLELNEKGTGICYTNPTVKVLINGNGEIINGTWRYTVDIRLNDYKAFGKDVKTTSVVMDNTLTVNGGFKK